MALSTLIAHAEAVIFDFDGVLVDSEPLWYESTRVAFARIGHHVDADEYWLHWATLGEGISGELSRHDLELTPSEIEALAQERRRHYRAGARSGQLQLHQPMLAALRLVTRHKPCAIASNSAEPDIRAILAAAGERLSCPLVGHRRGLRKKPAPDIFTYTAGVLGVTPDRCLVIEDTRKGLEAAHTLSMDCIIIQTPHNRAADFSDAELVLGSHAELLSALQAALQP